MGACSRIVALITKVAVHSTAFLLHIAEDSKGKALSGADLGLRSSQSRLICLLQSDKIGAVFDYWAYWLQTLKVLCDLQ